MAFNEADAARPFQQQLDVLKKHTGPITDVTAGGQLQQDMLEKSRFSEMQKARQGISSDVKTGQALSELTGSRGFESDIMGRSEDKLGQASDRAQTGSFERMADASRGDNLRFQDARGFDSSKRMADLETAKADAINKLRISEYQADQQGGIGSMIGGAVGAIGGIFVGNPMAGYAAGSAIGGYADTL